MSVFPTSFFFTDTATPDIYTLSLHDALPICNVDVEHLQPVVQILAKIAALDRFPQIAVGRGHHPRSRSEEHTSELQSRVDLVCRLLLEKKKKKKNNITKT